MQTAGPMKSYGFDRVTMNFGGIPAVAGADGDDVIQVEPSAERWKNKVGAAGDVVRSKVLDFTGKVTVKLMASSPTNDAWSALAALDRKGFNGAGVAPMEIKHLDGTTAHFASQAYILQVPTDQFGAEAGTREWQIFCADLDSAFGGY